MPSTSSSSIFGVGVGVLRDKSVADIQEAISKALSALTETDLVVSIGKVEFDDANWARQKVHMDLTIRTKKDAQYLSGETLMSGGTLTKPEP